MGQSSTWRGFESLDTTTIYLVRFVDVRFCHNEIKTGKRAKQSLCLAKNGFYLNNPHNIIRGANQLNTCPVTVRVRCVHIFIKNHGLLDHHFLHSSCCFLV